MTRRGKRLVLDIFISICLIIQIVLLGWLFIRGGEVGKHGLLMPLLIAADGYLLTNQHVASAIEVFRSLL